MIYLTKHYENRGLLSAPFLKHYEKTRRVVRSKTLGFPGEKQRTCAIMEREATEVQEKQYANNTEE